MRKGFLTSAPTKQHRRPKAAPADEVIRPKDPSAAADKTAGLKLAEVQDALRTSVSNKLDQDRSWLTADMIRRLGSDPMLRRGMQDPRVAQAMDEFSRSPEEAMAKYKHDAELMAFMQRFMKFMGSHFTGLAAADPGAGGTPSGVDDESDKLAKAALADPALRAVLEDVDVQRVLYHVQQGDTTPVEATLRDPAVVGKLQHLASAGLINMRWESSP